MQEYKVIINGIIRDYILTNEENAKAYKTIQIYNHVIKDIEENFLPVTSYLMSDNEYIRYDLRKASHIYNVINLDRLPKYRQALKEEKSKPNPNKKMIKTLTEKVNILEINQSFYEEHVVPFLKHYPPEELEKLMNSYYPARAKLNGCVGDAAEQLLKNESNKDFLKDYFYDLIMSGTLDLFNDQFFYIAFDCYIRQTRFNQVPPETEIIQPETETIQPKVEICPN